MPSFSLLDDALGKCDGVPPLEVRIQPELKAAIAVKAASEGFKNSSEAARFILAKWALGEDHVASLIAGQLGVYGLNAPHIAQAIVRTSAHKQ